MARQWLMEGNIENPDGETDGCIMYPSAAYVVQPRLEEGKEVGKQAFFFIGKPDSLTESIGDGVRIVESYDALELEEKRVGDRVVKLPKGTIYVEGVYQRSDVENANKRSYPRKIWEKHIADPKSKVMQAVRERAMLGHVEHPTDGRTDLKESGLLNVSLKLEKDGSVYGRSELLDTPNGLILQELTAKGVKWGISSRGNGTVDASGVVQEDFQLVTFDAVASPSTPGAYPKPFRVNSDKDESDVSEDDVQEFLEEFEEARNTDIAELNEAKLSAHASRIMGLLGKHYRLSQAQVLSKDKSDDVTEWFNALLRESVDEDDARVNALIEAATSASDNKDKSSAVIETLRSQLEEATDELDMLRDTVQDVRSALKEQVDRTDTLQGEVDVLEGQLADAVERAELAEQMIAEQTAVNFEDEVRERVDSILEEWPVLESLRPLLETSATPDEVEQHVRPLVESLGRVGKPDPDTSQRAVPVLPAGLVVESEKDAERPVKPTGTERRSSPGAVKAARVIAASR